MSDQSTIPDGNFYCCLFERDLQVFNRKASKLVSQGFEPSGAVQLIQEVGSYAYLQSFYRRMPDSQLLRQSVTCPTKGTIDIRQVLMDNMAEDSAVEDNLLMELMDNMAEDSVVEDNPMANKRPMKSSIIFTFADHGLRWEGDPENAQAVVCINVIGGSPLPQLLFPRIDIRIPLKLLGDALWCSGMEFSSVEHRRKETETQLQAHMDVDPTTRMILVEYEDGELELKEYQP